MKYVEEVHTRRAWRRRTYRKPAVGLLCLMLLIGSVTLSAQWKQTAGPSGVTPVAILSTGDVTLLGVTSGEIYSRNEGRWQKTGAFPEELPIKTGFGRRPGASWVLLNDILVANYKDNIITSADFGATWDVSGLDAGGLSTDGEAFYLIGYDPNLQSEPILKSTDGSSWKEVGELPPSSGDLFFFKGAMYVNNGFFLEVKRSDDEGMTWRELDTELPAQAKIVASGEKLYAVSHQGLFVSDDGMNWDDITSGLPEPVSLRDIQSTGEYVYVKNNRDQFYRYNGTEWEELDIPTVSRIIPINTGGVLTTTYNGDIFEVPASSAQPVSISDGFVKSSIYSLGSVDGVVIASSSAELYRTEDGGESWEPTSGFGGWTAFSFHTDGEAIYALDGTPYRSLDKGKTWELFGPRYPFELEGHNYHRNVSSLVTTEDGIFVSISEYGPSKSGGSWAEGGVFRSEDEGETWTEVSVGLPGSAVVAPVNSMAEQNGVLVVTTAAGLYRSDNGGDFWTPAMNGISSEDRNYPYGSGVVMEAAGKLLLKARYGLYESNDEGMTWTAISAPFLNDEISTSLMFDLDDELYVQTYEQDATGNLAFSLFKYNGTKWMDVTAWQPEGIQFTSMVRVGDYYYGGTTQDGVWVLDRDFSINASTSSVAIEESARATDDLNVHPNPTTGRATLSLESDHAGDAEATIFNVFGKKVSSTQHNLVRGENGLVVDLSTLSSETYYIRITMPNGENLTTQMQVVR